jgi:hypothetical protein
MCLFVRICPVHQLPALCDVTCASLYAVAHRKSFDLFCGLRIFTVRYQATPSFCLYLLASARCLLPTQSSHCVTGKTCVNLAENVQDEACMQAFEACTQAWRLFDSERS